MFGLVFFEPFGAHHFFLAMARQSHENAISWKLFVSQAKIFKLTKVNVEAKRFENTIRTNLIKFCSLSHQIDVIFKLWLKMENLFAANVIFMIFAIYFYASGFLQMGIRLFSFNFFFRCKERGREKKHSFHKCRMSFGTAIKSTSYETQPDRQIYQIKWILTTIYDCFHNSNATTTLNEFYFSIYFFFTVLLWLLLLFIRL